MTRTPRSASSLFYRKEAQEDKSTLFRNAACRLRIISFSWARPSDRLATTFRLRRSCGRLWSRRDSGKKFLRFRRRWVNQESTFSSIVFLTTSQLWSFLPLRPSSSSPFTTPYSSLLLPQPSCRPDSAAGFSSSRNLFGWDSLPPLLTPHTECHGILQCSCDIWPIRCHRVWIDCDFHVPSDWVAPPLPFLDLFHCQ